VIIVHERSQEQNRSHIHELVICGVLVLLSLWGIIWYEATGLLKKDIDGFLLLSICFLVGCVFSLQFLMIARSAGWLKTLRRNRTGKAVESNQVAEFGTAIMDGKLAGRIK